MNAPQAPCAKIHVSSQENELICSMNRSESSELDMKAHISQPEAPEGTSKTDSKQLRLQT